ncbi:FlaD/FlaE family flagellar protein [Haloprofundus salinisoli]|uniref:FlaD/FlaE family flagellar protein n=1 Tax=Haloprofundus salinisoli TaxID=2876193 RepID=UPI001CCC1444|nr:FlaD/FlaE family flagellar protein [Haloprofundus salinisoli]
MDIGNVLRSLGLEALAPVSQEEREETDRSGGAADGVDESAELDEEGGTGVRDGDDADGVGSGDAIEDLRHELDQVAADLETTQSKLRAVQSERDDMVARLDGLEDDTAQLLGVYDRLTAEVNPFDEQWRQSAEGRPSEGDSRYGVVSVSDGSSNGSVVETNGHTDTHAREDNESTDKAVEETPPAPPVDATESIPQAQVPSEVYLRGLAPSFATEVLLMEWMTMLIDSAGPGGAMKAVDYYERINWIDESVKNHLEDLLGGVQTAPLTADGVVDDLTSEEHSQSFAYIMKLDGLRATTNVT